MSQQYHPAFDKLIEQGFEFKHSKYIHEGFEMFKKQIGGFLGFTFAFYAIAFVIALIAGAIAKTTGVSIFENLGSITINILQPIFYAGIMLVANEIVKGNDPDFGKFLEGKKFWLPLVILSFVMGLLTVVGFVFLIIPGIYLAIGYSFANLFVIFMGYDTWTALELSRKIITKNWWSFFGFIIVIALINIGGLLACGIGILFTAPATMCMTYCAFEDIVGGAIREHDAQFPPQNSDENKDNTEPALLSNQEKAQNDTPVKNDLNESDYPKES